MRTLNLSELEQKINSYSTNIYFCDRIYAQEKISQFFTFLHEQSISRRILERISEDFNLIKFDLSLSGHNNSVYRTIPNHTIKVKTNIKNREDQGTFGFFIIQQLFEIEKNLKIVILMHLQFGIMV